MKFNILFFHFVDISASNRCLTWNNVYIPITMQTYLIVSMEPQKSINMANISTLLSRVFHCSLRLRYSIIYRGPWVCSAQVPKASFHNFVLKKDNFGKLQNTISKNLTTSRLVCCSMCQILIRMKLKKAKVFVTKLCSIINYF